MIQTVSRLPKISTRGLVSSQKRPWGFEVLVDYDCHLDESVDECQLDVVDSRIEERFCRLPQKGNREAVLRLVCSRNSHIVFNDVARWLHTGGMRPANIRELIALGRDFPLLFARRAIVATGSIVRLPNEKRPLWIPTLVTLKSSKPKISLDRSALMLRCFDQCFDKACWFLAAPLKT